MVEDEHLGLLFTPLLCIQLLPLYTSTYHQHRIEAAILYDVSDGCQLFALL